MSISNGQSVLLYATRACSQEIIVGGMDRVLLSFTRPHFDATPRGKDDLPMFSELPKGWQRSSRTFRAKYTRACDTLYRAIWDGVLACHPDAGTDDWSEDSASIHFQDWLFEVEAEITKPFGDGKNDLEFFITDGPINTIDQGEDRVMLWMRKPKYQIIDRIDEDFVTEYKVSAWHDGGNCGAGCFEVPEALRQLVDVQLKERGNTPKSEWIGSFTVGLKIKTTKAVSANFRIHNEHR